MQIASLSQLKKELKDLTQEDLLTICLRLGRYKKDNKELLHYLLLEAHDESAYIELIKSDISEGFETVNTSSLFLAKKTIRKVLRNATKQIRYSGQKETELEVLIYYCESLIALNIRLSESKVLINLLKTQLNKINKALGTLHEDLQFDYKDNVELLESWVNENDHYL